MKSDLVVLVHPSGKIVHLKPGFCWPAFLLGPMWAFVKRLWLPCAALVAAGLLINALGGYALYAGSIALNLLSFALSIVYMAICGHYGNRWRRAALLRQGYRPVSPMAETAAAVDAEIQRAG